MKEIGRNSPCPCGSGKKYKRCCQQKETDITNRKLPAGKFRYESGSYGGPGRGYMPSIIGYKEIGGNSWQEHLCLVKSDTVLDDEDVASAISEKHLEDAKKNIDLGGSPQAFAISLRREGYKSVTDFRVIKTS